jgi:hypothetical protein
MGPKDDFVLPKLSEVESNLDVSSVDSEFRRIMDLSNRSQEGGGEVDVEAPAKPPQDAPKSEDISMYTSDEIHAAMTAQDWDKLGHASSALVAATDCRETIIVRASALLEHHLLRVLKEKDANAVMPLTVKVQIRKFVCDVASKYNGAKFHSLSHAIHVTTSMNKLLSVATQEDPLNSFSLVFSALLHDAGHTGMSNKILKESKHPLSEKYEDGVPTAEKYSIDIALELLYRPEYESLRSAILPNTMSKIEFAKTLFQGILVTDIATPEHIKLNIERYEVSQEEKSEYDVRICPLASHVEDVFDGVGLDESVKDEYPSEFVITHEGLQKCVKNEHLMLLSDVSHLMQGWENFAKWNFRLCTYFHHAALFPNSSFCANLVPA